MTLTEFLLERYDEDDELARSMEGNVGSRDQPSTAWFTRLRADAAARRRIVELHGRRPDGPQWCPTCATPDDNGTGLHYERYPCPTMLALAQPYVDHIEFRAEWWPADKPLERSRWQTQRHTSWLQEYQGLGLEQAKRRAEEEARAYRVIGPHTVVTADWRADRLNLIVDADNNLTNVTAG